MDALGKAKPCRENADHRIGFSIQVDGSIQDGRIASEAAFPQTPAQKHGPVCGRPIVGCSKVASLRR